MIKVELEPTEFRREGAELCCFCWKPTRYWSGGGWIACCRSCAKEHDEKDLPTRDEWWEKAAAKRRAATI